MQGADGEMQEPVAASKEFIGRSHRQTGEPNRRRGMLIELAHCHQRVDPIREEAVLELFVVRLEEPLERAQVNDIVVDHEDASTRCVPGPRTVLRPAVPCVPFAGTTYAVGSNQ